MAKETVTKSEVVELGNAASNLWLSRIVVSNYDHRPLASRQTEAFERSALASGMNRVRLTQSGDTNRLWNCSFELLADGKLEAIIGSVSTTLFSLHDAGVDVSDVDFIKAYGEHFGAVDLAAKTNPDASIGDEVYAVSDSIKMHARTAFNADQNMLALLAA